MRVTDQLNSAADVEVIAASPEQEPVLANMLELYVHDFSEFMDLKLGPDGRFGYQSLPLYWKESNRYPFLVMADGNLAGFVFVRGGSAISDEADVWDMAEFFIVRGFRGRRVGTQAAQEIWKRFPGKWEVRVTDRNEKARSFWDRAVGEFLGETIKPRLIDKDGKTWHVFSFESRNIGSQLHGTQAGTD